MTMGKLLLIGASLLAFHGGHHQPRYWWPAMDLCNTAVVPTVCSPVPAHWATTPPPQFAGLPGGTQVSPQAMCGPVYCKTGKPDF